MLWSDGLFVSLGFQQFSAGNQQSDGVYPIHESSSGNQSYSSYFAELYLNSRILVSVPLTQPFPIKLYNQLEQSIVPRLLVLLHSDLFLWLHFLFPLPKKRFKVLISYCYSVGARSLHFKPGDKTLLQIIDFNLDITQLYLKILLQILRTLYLDQKLVS